MPKSQTSTKKCSKHGVVHINGGYASCPMNKKKVESLKAYGFAEPSTKKVVKEKTDIRIISLGVYPYDVLFTVGTTEKEVTDYLEKRCKYILDAEEKSFLGFVGKAGRTVRLKNNAIILWTKDHGLPTIGHEIFHVVELLMEKLNVPLNDHTSETYAYLIEYLWREITKPTKQRNAK